MDFQILSTGSSLPKEGDEVFEFSNFISDFSLQSTDFEKSFFYKIVSILP